MSDELFQALNEEKSELADAMKAIEGKYRHVFVGSQIGLDVLADILVVFCHFGCFIDDAYQMAQHNVGVNILSRCGIFKPENRQNVIRSMVNAIPSPRKEE
jgi:hypothetical protein